MLSFWKSRNMRLILSHRIYILAGLSSLVLAAVVITLSTQSVHANARLSKPASTAPPVLSATPPTLEARKPARESRTDMLRGLATWYGSVLNGHHTASGERFNMYAMTACHPTLPFGTMVRVVNLNNHKNVVVRINDRGELDEGRVIDVSYAAAEKLHIVKGGVAPVAIEVISANRPRHKK
jgi:rare lipoprotein A